MQIEEALRTYIISRPALAPLIGARVYPLVLPQGVKGAAIAYQRISNAGQPDIPWAHPRIQFSVYASGYLECRDLAQKLKDELHRFKGVLSGIQIESVTYVGGIGPMQDPDTQRYSEKLDFIVNYKEG